MTTDATCSQAHRIRRPCRRRSSSAGRHAGHVFVFVRNGLEADVPDAQRAAVLDQGCMCVAPTSSA
jgi:hypothetical protein